MVRRLTFKELCERNPLFKKIFTKMDTNWVKEDGPEMAMGNVFKTMPHSGAPFGNFADRADVGVRLSVDKPGIYYCKFGALVLRKNGVYKYKLYGENQRPNAFAAVQGLSEGETLREVFRYKVTNGFLKKFSALKITIFGTDDDVHINGLDVQGADHYVCEENLSNGSNPDDKLLTSPNSFEVSARDGFKFLKIAGVTVIDGNGPVAGVIGTPINTQYGQITIVSLTKTAFDTYVVEYKFELTGSTPDHMTQGKDAVFESVLVELEDEDGSNASDTIDISVKDDVPTAVLTLKPGAMLLVDETDGVAADMNETDALGGDLGMSSLTAAQLFDDASTFGADGPAAMGSKKFELLLTLGDGSDSGLDDHGTMTDILLYAVDDQTIEGRVGGAMGPVSFRLEIDVNNGTAKLTQLRAVYHDDPMDHDESTSPAVLADDLIQVKLTVTDGDSVGDTDVAYVSLNGVIKFEDDGLMANDDDDFASVGECDTNNGVVIGNISDLLANDTFGSDEQGNPAIVVSPTGNMGGTVTIDMMGNITYTNTTPAADLDIGQSLYETFTYTIYDGDNDSSQATFSVTTSGTDIVIDTAPTDVSVDEDDLPKGVGDNADGDLLTPVPNGSIAYTLSAGATTATVVLAASPTFTKLDGTAITAVWDAMTNTLTGYGIDPMDVVFTIVVTNLTATGFDYELSLEQAVKHLGTDPGFEDDLTFDVNVTITDDCNEEATTSFQALIDDDIPAPTPFPDFASITECEAKDGFDIDFGSLYNNDFGADMGGGVGIAGTGDMGGTLTPVNGGVFKYQNTTAAADLDIGETLVETFQYYITDSEGDLVESTFTITVTGSDIVIDTAPTNVSVDEDDLPKGVGDNADGDLLTPVPNGSIAYTLSAGATTATVALSAAPTFTKLDGTAITAVWDAMTNTLTGYGTDPMDVVFTIVVTNLTATGFDYELSLEQAVKHLGSSPGFEDDLTFNVDVTITDDCNEEATTSFQALIDDDIPVPTADPNFRTFNECDVKNGVDLGNLNQLANNDSFGADERAFLGFVPSGDKGGTIAVVNGRFIYTNNTAAADLGIGETLVETFTYLIDDGDRDRTPSTFSIVTNGSDIVIDTAPTNVSVDEDDLPNGNNDSANGDLVTPVPTGSIAYTLSAGATTATVVLAASPMFTKLDGTGITAAWDAMTNTLTGYGTDPMDVVFTIVVTNLTATGFDYELSLAQPVKHLGTDPGFEDNLSFNVGVTITDDCNEEETTSFQALIDDDIPVAIAPVSSSLTNTTNAMVMAALDVDGNIDDNVGADQPGTLTFDNVVSGVTQATGEINGQNVNLTSNGDPIILYLSSNDTVLEGWTGDPMMGGTKIFSVTLNLDGDLMLSNDKYTVQIFESIDNGAGVTFTNLDDGQAGNPPFAIISEMGTDLELLFTPINENSINSDTDDVGVGGQFIDIGNPDQGLRIDFGDFTFHPNGGGPSDNGFTIVDHETINNFRFSIDQVSNGTTADVILAAYDANEGSPNQSPINATAPGGMHNFTDDTLLAITEVQIFDDMGMLVGIATGDATFGGITVDFDPAGSPAGTVFINDLLAGYSVVTETASGYDRLEITNAGSAAMGSTDGKFSISELSVGNVDTGDPIGLSFDVALHDAEGDAAALIGQIDVTVNPDVMVT